MAIIKSAWEIAMERADSIQADPAKIKKDLNKLENEFLTIEEFCTYSGIKYEQVTHLIFG